MNSNDKKEEKEKNIEKLEEIIKDSNKIVGDYSKKIRNRLIENVVIGMVFAIYFYFLYLGSQNIDSAIYIVDLKVFAVGLLATAIILFEKSYKKDNGNLCVHGIETLVLAIETLFLVYLYSLFIARAYTIIIVSMIILSIFYFMIKSVVSYFKMQKCYFKSKNDINDIIKNK